MHSAQPSRPRPEPATAWPTSSLVAGLGAATRAALLGLGTARRFAPGHRIIEEGTTSTFVVLLRAGFVKIRGRLEDGRQALLAIRTRGDLVGELAALDGGPRSGTVTACSHVEANVIPQGDFVRLLCLRSDAALELHRMLAYRLRQANRRRLDFAGCAAGVRVARVLVELAEIYGRPTPRGTVCDLRVTQLELADLGGTSEKTVQTVLHQLREAGVLDTGYRRIEVFDMPTLHRAAHLTS
ncbi:Crp/Fnr family transcriptional regulator [Actinomadura kijaniata]|uniref:Crp/Fnr family transcriptional regulator n=1 Tax=Actinomadura kijaniata TaxID=46161 RepID=UPI000831B357|nr:Crp/Fnr family transcriptional regulator [Actinomadura kijaniata]